MRSGVCSTLFVVSMLVIGAATSPTVGAGVDQQQAKVDQIADDLEALENRIGELEEQHAGALDRIDELEGEIAVSQAKVDAQQVALAGLRGQMSSIAVDKFTAGGATGLTPLFSTAESFTEELQRGELARVALDQGAGDSDELQQLVEDLNAETTSLEQNKTEQADLLASLEGQQAEGDALVAQYEQQYAEATAELGNLVREEQERRAAAAIAKAQQAQTTTVAAPAQPRGGGAAPSSGGSAPAAPSSSDSGGGDSGGASTPAPAPEPAASVPPPASTAGIAVNAAMGQLGVPYRFAAEQPGVAFDCSGLTKYAWGRAGVYLPHQSRQQYASTPHVPADQAQPGDLIFYYSPISHVAIYLGGGSLIHAPATGDVVKVSSVSWNKVIGVSRPG